MKTAALLPNEAKSPPKIISSEGATSLAKRLHSFISHARGDFIPANKKTALGLLFCWLGWRDSDPRMTESKSVALPLGYIPIYVAETNGPLIQKMIAKSQTDFAIMPGVDNRIRTDGLQGHNLTR